MLKHAKDIFYAIMKVIDNQPVKTIFLGVLYGLGKNSLAERLECDVEEADRIIQSLYKSFPQLRVYVEEQGEYPLDHDGYIRTMLGDKLKVVEWDYLLKATTNRERNNLIARIKRLGVNLPIQGFMFGPL